MTPQQLATAMELVRVLRVPDQLQILNHGACDGADRQIHPVVSHHEMYPSNYEQMVWARAVARATDVIHDRIGDPIKRNREMVDVGAIVVAAPQSMTEILRSGTWATIRYAKKQGKTLYICWPDGTITPS